MGSEKGAEDGWYRTATLVDTLEINGTMYSGGPIDIRKCFDQVPRPVLYALARKAWMSEQVLTTYLNFQEHLRTYNTIPCGLREPFKRRCGIPQCDKLSIMFVGLYSRPWVTIMEAVGAPPRVLADDMRITAHGHDHVEVFKTNNGPHSQCCWETFAVRML